MARRRNWDIIQGKFGTFDDFAKAVKRTRLRNKSSWWGANANVAGFQVELKAYGPYMAVGRYRIDGIDWTPGHGDGSVKYFNEALAAPFKQYPYGSRGNPSRKRNPDSISWQIAADVADAAHKAMRHGTRWDLGYVPSVVSPDRKKIHRRGIIYIDEEGVTSGGGYTYIMPLPRNLTRDQLRNKLVPYVGRLPVLGEDGEPPAIKVRSYASHRGNPRRPNYPNDPRITTAQARAAAKALAESKGYAAEYKLPFNAKLYLINIRTRNYDDAAFIEAQYPVDVAEAKALLSRYHSPKNPRGNSSRRRNAPRKITSAWVDKEESWWQGRDVPRSVGYTLWVTDGGSHQPRLAVNYPTKRSAERDLGRVEAMIRRHAPVAEILAFVPDHGGVRPADDPEFQGHPKRARRSNRGRKRNPEGDIAWGASGGVIWGQMGHHDVFTIERPSLGAKWVLKFYEDGKLPGRWLESGHDVEALQRRGDQFYARFRRGKAFVGERAREHAEAEKGGYGERDLRRAQARLKRNPAGDIIEVGLGGIQITDYEGWSDWAFFFDRIKDAGFTQEKAEVAREYVSDRVPLYQSPGVDQGYAMAFGLSQDKRRKADNEYGLPPQQDPVDRKRKGRRRKRNPAGRHPLDGVRRHQLLPKGLAKKIPALYSQENVSDPIARVKFFSPYAQATWYITEFDGEDTMFGWVDMGHGGELGYISLSELQGANRRGLPLVERDMYWSARSLSEATGKRSNPRRRNTKR